MSKKTYENKLRRALMKEGYLLKKSRGGLTVDNFGAYQIVDATYNAVVAGTRFDMELEDIAVWLAS